MWDTPRRSSRSRLAVVSVVAGLVLFAAGLGVGGYALARPEVRQALLSPRNAAGATALAASTSAPAESTAGRSASSAELAAAAGPATDTAAPASALSAAESPQTPDNTSLDAMITQLAEMQQSLVAAAAELGAASPTPQGPQPRRSFGAAPANSPIDEGVLAEIEQLYQSMRPLMVQLEAASSTSRSPSELAAMRSQMAGIHARLTELMAQVEAGAKDPLNATSTPAPAVQVSGEGQTNGQVDVYLQLQQTLAELTGLLGQLQSVDIPQTP